MKNIEISEKNYMLLDAIIKSGFEYRILIDNSRTDKPKDMNEVVEGLLHIAYSTDYIDENMYINVRETNTNTCNQIHYLREMMVLCNRPKDHKEWHEYDNGDVKIRWKP